LPSLRALVLTICLGSALSLSWLSLVSVLVQPYLCLEVGFDLAHLVSVLALSALAPCISLGSVFVSALIVYVLVHISLVSASPLLCLIVSLVSALSMWLCLVSTLVLSWLYLGSALSQPYLCLVSSFFVSVCDDFSAYLCSRHNLSRSCV
jgi:hypothetical protein